MHIHFLWRFQEKIYFQDEEYVEGDAAREDGGSYEAEEAAVTTTTDSPKKIRPSVRPFRSNEELLQTLKKRRLNEKNNKSSGEISSWSWLTLRFG